jgi:hypothetical protein
VDDDEDKAENEYGYVNERTIIIMMWMRMTKIMTDDLTFFRFSDKAMTMTEKMRLLLLLLLIIIIMALWSFVKPWPLFSFLIL